MSTGSSNSEVVDFFLVETSDHLQNINADLLALEQQQDDEELVDRLFRSIHGIKGSAGMVGFSVISQFAHKIENLLGEIRDKKVRASGEIIDFLFQVIDILTQQVDDLANGHEEDETILTSFGKLYSQAFTSALPSPVSSSPKPPAFESPPVPNLVRPEISIAEEYIKQNHIEEGIKLYQKMLRVDPDNKTLRQRLEEARVLYAYLKEHPGG